METKVIRVNKKVWPILMAVALIAGLIYIFFNTDLVVINNRDVYLEVLEDGSIKVEEIWEADIDHKSTLFISFLREEAEAFKDISVSYFEDDQWKKMEKNEQISSNGKEEENFFHAGFFEHDFEIAWGTGLEYDKGQRKYKIEYIKEMTFLEQNSVNNYNDIGQLYHKFVDVGYETPIKNFTAFIKFKGPVNKDNARIWGHGVESGEIHFKDNGVIITANNVKPNNMIEARVLFPKELIPLAKVNKNFNAQSEIIAEESINTSQTRVLSKFSLSGKNGIYIYSTAYVFAFALIFYLLNKRKKETDELPAENPRIWEVFTDQPKVKLDFFLTNIILGEESFPKFLNTIIMKLSFNKTLNIETVKEADPLKLENNKKLQNELFYKFIGEGVALDQEKVDYLNEEFDKIEKRYARTNLKATSDKSKDLIYTIDLNKYKTTRLDDDEELVVDFLLSSITKTYMRKLIYYESKQKKHSSTRIAESKVKLDQKEWLIKENEFKKILVRELEEIHIEQYSILMELHLAREDLDKKYATKNTNKKAELTNSGIFSKAKEEIANNKSINLFLSYVLLGIGIYFLPKVIGPVVFAKEIYLAFLFITVTLQSVVQAINYNIHKKLEPYLNEEGLNMHYELVGLRNFLSNSSFISEYDEKSVVIWGEFLVYATYFGVTTKVLEALKATHPEVVREMETSTNYHSFNNALLSYSAFSRATTSGYYYSSNSGGTSSGYGGGFSSGGGGGGGGGRRWKQIISYNI